MQEQVTNISQEVSDWSVRSSGLQAELEREREERKAEVHELTERFQEESKVTPSLLPCFFPLGSYSDIILYFNTMKFHKTVSHCACQVRLAFLHCVYQRLLAGCVLLHQPQSMLGNFTWEELYGVINEQVDQLNSDLKNAKEKASVFRFLGAMFGVISCLSESVPLSWNFDV